jgi:hypothetical protein
MFTKVFKWILSPVKIAAVKVVLDLEAQINSYPHFPHLLSDMDKIPQKTSARNGIQFCVARKSAQKDRTRTYIQLHVYFKSYDMWIVNNASTLCTTRNTYLLTYCMEQSPKEVNRLSGGQEIPRILTFYSLAVSLRTNRFPIQKFYMVLALRWVSCTHFRTHSDLCFIRH